MRQMSPLRAIVLEVIQIARNINNKFAIAAHVSLSRLDLKI